MNALWPLALITYKEGIRNRSIYGISLFALVLLGVNLLISGMMMRSAGKTAVEMSLSTVSLCGLLLVFFVGINLIAKDLDRRTIYMVLARPISRPQYLIGKFLGMVILIAVAMLVLGTFACVSILLVKHTSGDYFQRFTWVPVLQALVMTGEMLVLLTALTFLFASITSTSFITLALTIITYIIGQSIGDVKALIEAPAAIGAAFTVSPATLMMVKAAYYVFPNFSFFDVKLQAAHGMVVPLSYLLWTTAYGAVYTLIVLTIASFLFRRKEFP